MAAAVRSMLVAVQRRAAVVHEVDIAVRGMVAAGLKIVLDLAVDLCKPVVAAARTNCGIGDLRAPRMMTADSGGTSEDSSPVTQKEGRIDPLPFEVLDRNELE
jgi:hypothetical protein